MQEKYRWVLSPSRFEAASGCPCYEEDPRAGAAFKLAGTNLHSYMEEPDKSIDELDEEQKDMIQFCRAYEARVEDMLTEGGTKQLVFDDRELYIAKSDDHPGGLIDRIMLSESGLLAVIDWKFGVMPVPSPAENPQIKAYVLMALSYVGKKGLDVSNVMGSICQPALSLIDEHFFTPEDIAGIGDVLRATNDRVADPFKQPDPSDPDKCRRCMYSDGRCPAVAGAVQKFVNQAELLPHPEQLHPSAIVSVPDRILAQQLASILEAWASKVKASNKEYAEQNGGTIGGIYNLSTRSNGYEIKDVEGLANGLVEAGLLDKPEDIIHMVKVTKTRLIEGLTELTPEDNAKVKTIINELEEQYGEARPPVTMLRKGGKKQIAEALSIMDVPMLQDPFK